MSDINHDPSIKKIEENLSYLARWLEANNRRRNYPLERAHYLLLRLLTEKSPQSSGVLALQLGLDSSTVTRQIKAMIDLDLIERLADPTDRRGCLINVTPIGIEKFNETQAKKRTNTAKVFHEWTSDEKASLAHLLAKLNESISKNLDNN
ncbi:MAG: hypothetical protein CENE_02959 [Candidatus Celerinatantimonas neptuna]|nr:MAG: hypothetical protein CENE_02959 [Candidatus Celerinatantimonas neptuna]